MQQSPRSEEPQRFNLSRWALQHIPLTRYLMVAILLLGAAAYFQLGQDEDPPFTFRAMVVRTYWPGASAQQVAEQVTDKIERTLQEVPYADKISSYSKPGESQVIFQVRDNSRPQDVANLWYTVRKKIGDMQYTLPQGVQGPFFNDEFGDVYGVIYGLHGEGYSYAELKTFADTVRQQLLRVKDVSKVELFGTQSEKLFVEMSQKRLAQMGLDISQVVGQLNQQNAVVGAGVLQTSAEQIQVRVTGQFDAVEQVRQMPLRAPSGTQLRLGDIAQVTRGYEEPPGVKVRHNGREVIAIGIAMSKGGDIVGLGQALRAQVAEAAAALPAGVYLDNIQDQPKAVTDSVNEFLKVLVEAVVVVLAVSFISLGLHQRAGATVWWRRWYVDPRPGLVVAVTIPLVLAATFLAMWYWGIGLHKISLGSLIIALGLLVDDAIIAVEMMVLKLEEGYDKLRAATFAYDITAKPMLTGTLITAAGFLPIGMAKSMTGEYTFAIFAVTVIALVLSWLASVYFVPYLGSVFLRESPRKIVPGVSDDPHEVFDSPFYQAFRKMVYACVQHRWLTIACTAVVFALGVWGMTKVQQQFFPDSNRPEILVDAWFPEGTSFAGNEAVVKRLEAHLQAAAGVEHVTVWVGSGVPRFYLPLDQVFPQANVSQFIVMTESLRARNELMQRLPSELAQAFPEVRARAKLLPSGPPVAYPVQFRVMGPDPQKLRVLADQVKAVMQAHPDMRGVNDNWNESVKAVKLEIDQDKARALGVSSQSIAQATQTLLSGTIIGQYREDDRLINIVLRQPWQERSSIQDISQTYVPTASGLAIPLTQIAQPVLGWEPGVMWRDARAYAITVQGDVRDGLQGATLTAALQPELKRMQAQWRDEGLQEYHISVAGAVEESAKGAASIAVGIPVMLFLVFTLLMLQLHSFSRALLVFLTGPLGIAGVAAALLLLDRPFGFVALLGVIALMGMIQRNSVILIDQIETDRARGVPTWDAIVESAVRRFRPIVLTAAAAVLAMIPLSRSVFWGPMAVAIMGGLIVATVLTLFALPAMYAACFRVKKPEIQFFPEK